METNKTLPLILIIGGGISSIISGCALIFGVGGPDEMTPMMAMFTFVAVVGAEILPRSGA